MDVAVPGLRDVRATLDRPTPADGETAPPEPGVTTDAVVVACPPHPRMGGSRSDARLRTVSETLAGCGVACLRFDYGPWDEGRGECVDAVRAVEWAHERYDRAGLFGYSFGGAVAVLSAARLADGDDGGEPVAALSTLAAASRLDGEGTDAAAALDRVACPTQVVYGERDDTADWTPLVERARELGHETAAMGADHHFVGQRETVATTVATFFAGALNDR